MSLAKWLPFKFDRKRAAAESESSGPPAAPATGVPARGIAWPMEPLRAFQQLFDEPYFLDPFAGLGASGAGSATIARGGSCPASTWWIAARPWR
jgi:hypothetical protein